MVLHPIWWKCACKLSSCSSFPSNFACVFNTYIYGTHFVPFKFTNEVHFLSCDHVQNMTVKPIDPVTFSCFSSISCEILLVQSSSQPRLQGRAILQTSVADCPIAGESIQGFKPSISLQESQDTRAVQLSWEQTLLVVGACSEQTQVISVCVFQPASSVQIPAKTKQKAQSKTTTKTEHRKNLLWLVQLVQYPYLQFSSRIKSSL